jgi:hypothetical protein
VVTPERGGPVAPFSLDLEQVGEVRVGAQPQPYGNGIHAFGAEVLHLDPLVQAVADEPLPAHPDPVRPQVTDLGIGQKERRRERVHGA